MLQCPTCPNTITFFIAATQRVTLNVGQWTCAVPGHQPGDLKIYNTTPQGPATFTATDLCQCACCDHADTLAAFQDPA